MKNIEALKELRGIPECFSSKKLRDALTMAIAALERLIPDPETGLVSCGCGGQAQLFGSSGDDDSYCYECSNCNIDSLNCATIKEAKFAWNRAMGLKG